MTESTVSPTPPRKRRRWLRLVAWVLGVLILLLVGFYFIATSSGFFTGVILPRVSKTLNAEVTASDASIHPFKEVVLHNLKVQTQGAEPLLTAAEVRARYSLMDILRGNIHVDEVAVSSPTLILVENPDGSRNLDALLKGQKEKSLEKRTSEPAKPSKPVLIDLKKLTLSEVTVRNIKLYKGGNRDMAELSHLNVSLDDLKNGQTAKLQVKTDLQVENNPPQPGAKGLLQARLNCDFKFSLSPDLKPTSIQGNARLEVSRAEDAMAELAALGADLDCEVTPTDIKQVALRFQKGAVPLGQLRVSGPFDMGKTEGNLRVEVLSIDKQVLNLAGAKSGVDFGTTTINSTNEIQLAKSGSVITAVGEFDASKVQLSRTNQTTPPLDLRAQYNVTVNQAEKTALLRGLTIAATQKGSPLLRTELTSPMNLAWGNVSNAVGDSALNLSLTSLSLADWRPFVGDLAPEGTVNLKLKLLSQQAGKQLTFDLNAQVASLTAGAGTNQITQAGVTLQVSGKATDLKQINLSDCKLQVAHKDQPMLTVSASGTYDLAGQSADMQIALEATLANILRAMPQTDVSVSSGTATLKGHLTQKQQTQNIAGNLALVDFTGRAGKNEFRSFGSTIELDVTKTLQQIQIRKVAGKLTEGGNAGGSFEVSGTYELTSKSAQLSAKLADFNQNGLRPFLEPLLADKKLISVAINATTSAQYNPLGDSALKADLQLANLVVNDPNQQFPATPLEAKLQVDASFGKQVADVRQCQITLTPTPRATNQVQLSGRVDLSQTNAIQGNLKLVANSLDMTSYYDLFVGEKKTAARKPAASTVASAPAPSTPDANQEPAPMTLPFHKLTADVSIGRFYLREIEVTNLQASASIDGGHVVLNPFKLSLNGAPVNATADLDLGVPGYKYDVGLGAQAIPLAPLVNSFQPERKGQIAGTLTAQVKVGGAGTTGAGLQKNLAGQFDVSSTNLNLSVVNLRSPLLKTLINVIGMVPELASSPENAVGTLLGGLTGVGRGGLSDELSKSPIDSILLHGSAGSGRFDLRQAVVRSPAFLAEASGGVTLAPILTNSPIEIPVSVSLSRSIAERINLASANTPASLGYVKLPDFVTMRGTVGKPKPDINKLALAGTAIKGVAGAIPSLGGKAGGVVQGLGGLLTGRQPGATDSGTNASANQPATNAPLGNLLDQFFKPKKK